ncbi:MULTISPECIES: hypothetical protein [unclassified Vibrio]|nr:MULTISPECIES: hypothetical protein [unclassified Vibrio]
MVNRDLRNALQTWHDSDIREYNQAPLGLRVIGAIIVAASTMLALLN